MGRRGAAIVSAPEAQAPPRVDTQRAAATRPGEPDVLSPGEPRRIAYLYLLPSGIVYVAFVLLPLLHTVVLSFFRWDGITTGRWAITPGTWAGLANYRDLFGDAEARGAFVHAFVLLLFYSFLPALIGLLLAASITRTRVRGMTAYRTILFLPQVLSMVVVAVAWRWIYAPQGGLNQILNALGLGRLSRAWLGDFTWALPSLGFVGAWVMFGLTMVLFISGIQKIPTSLYDAAKVDGAGPLREFLTVTLPALRNEMVVALTLTMVAALRSFDLVFVTTKGGPGQATEVPGLLVYVRAFQIGDVGSASAISVALALVIFGLTFLVIRRLGGEPA